jgi:hypothetical protein
MSWYTTLLMAPVLVLVQLLLMLQLHSYWYCYWQSASMSWCQAPIWDPQAIFPLVFLYWQLWFSWCGASSLMRGWICNLLVHLLLGLARAVTLGLEFLRPTVDQCCLGIGPPFGTLDQILACSYFFVWQLLFLLSKAPSLTRKRVCSLQCNHSLVRLLMPKNHTLPSHLRLCSLFVVGCEVQYSYKVEVDSTEIIVFSICCDRSGIVA